MRARILVLYFVFMIVSCETPNKNEFEVELSEELEDVITNYALENNIDENSKVLTSEWVVHPNDKLEIYISNMATDLYKKKNYTPTYYCLLKSGSIVFIYSNLEGLIDRETASIHRELNQILLTNGVHLEPDRGYDYSAPTWKYSSCPGKPSTLLKKIDPMEYSFIPCGYVLRQHPIRTDSLYIMKDEQ